MQPVRFALVGFGAWGSHHAAAIEKTAGAQLVAVAARSPETRARAQAAYPSCSTYADYRELVARSDVDVVDVVLPSDLHFEVGRAVLEADKHLLLEKPMAISVEQCRVLNALADERKKRIAVGFELRLSELWGKVRSLIRDGAVGDVQYAVIELWRRPYRPGSEGWRFDIDRVGDWILEEPIHFFDLARWYFSDVGEPQSVYACANSRNPDRPQLQDNFSAMLRFPRGGHAIITQTLSAYEHHQTVKLTGTRGAVWANWSGTMDRDLHPSSSLKHFDGEEVHDVPLSRPTGEVFELEDEIATVVGAIRDGTALAASGIDGARSVAICQAARESVDRGQEIPLSS